MQLEQPLDKLSGLSVVIPVYKENPIIVENLYNELTALGAEVIVVDDGSHMDLDIPYITYPGNVGYGYAIKTGIINCSNDVVCTADGDGQHEISDIIVLYKTYRLVNECKMIVGSRFNLKEDFHRWFFRKILNFIASCISGHYLQDLNSGLRLFDKKMAVGYSPILCDTFSFTTSLTMSVVTDNHKMFYVPINVQPRKYGKSRVKLIKDGVVTLYYIVWVGLALRTRGIRAWIRNLGSR